MRNKILEGGKEFGLNFVVKIVKGVHGNLRKIVQKIIAKIKG